MSDLVKSLLAVLDAAQAEAEAATAGPWFVHEYIDHDCDFEATVGTDQDPAHADAGDVIGHGYEGGGVAKLADARFIVRHNPAAVLRRIEADRKLIAEHQSTVGWDGGSSNGRVCATCAQDTQDGDRSGDPYPCATLRYLAEGWGVATA